MAVAERKLIQSIDRAVGWDSIHLYQLNVHTVRYGSGKGEENVDLLSAGI